MNWPTIRTTPVRMKCLLACTAAALLVTGCDAGPPATTAQASQADFSTVNTVAPRPAPLEQPLMLHDEAPPLKPKVLPWETPKPIVFSAEDEELRASLPFSPAIAMDPVDGSKISIRATTPTIEYEGLIYYFSSEANLKLFQGNPESALKGGFMKL